MGLAAFAFFCCTDEYTPGSAIPEKDTQMQLKSVAVDSGLQTASGTNGGFANGDTIGLYLDEYRFGSPFVFAARSNYGWQLSEPVFLTDKPLRLMAYYPYRHSGHARLSEKAVYVEHVTQTDYMYGLVSGGYVSREQPYADILMRHALALVRFRFIRNDYPHDCSVGRIAIRNAEGVHLLHSRGSLDLESGQVDPVEGYYDQATIRPYDMNFYDPEAGPEQYACILVIPTGPVRENGDLFFEFEIDGHIYIWPVKAGTLWQAGMKYTYQVEMVPAARTVKTSGIAADINVVFTRTSKY